MLAQLLGDRQDEVGGRGPVRQLPGELEADDARDQHRDRLPEHRRLGLDPADTPAEHPETVDHRRVAVGADHRVGVGHSVAHHHDAREIFDVDLMHDARAWWDDLELVESGLPPAQELIALAVAAVLDVGVDLEGIRTSKHISDHGVVDDQLGRGQRVDRARVAAEILHSLTHRGEVDDARHSGEVLHDHARGRELDFRRWLRRGVPRGHRPDVVGSDVDPVLGAEQVLQQDLQGVRQPLGTVHGTEREHLHALVPHGQGGLGTKAVDAHGCPFVVEANLS